MVVGQARYTRQARRRRRGAAPLAARSATLCSAQLAAGPRPRLSIAPSPRAASPRCTFGAPLRGTPRQSRAGRCTRRPGGGRGESGRRCRAVRPPCASEPRVRRRRPHPPRESRPGSGGGGFRGWRRGGSGGGGGGVGGGGVYIRSDNYAASWSGLSAASLQACPALPGAPETPRRFEATARASRGCPTRRGASRPSAVAAICAVVKLAATTAAGPVSAESVSSSRPPRVRSLRLSGPEVNSRLGVFGAPRERHGSTRLD